MKRIAISLAIATFGTGTAISLAAQGTAPMQLPGSPDPSALTGGTYEADSAHSLVGWRVNHLGFNDYFGIFGDVTGTLELNPNRLGDAKVDVTIPISSVLVASPGLKEHLLKPAAEGGKPDFFGPEPKPARFVSTKVDVDAKANTAVITGNFTLNGTTKPVTLSVRFTGAGTGPMNKAETIGFEGEASIKRSDFGIGYGIPMVSDEVQLQLTAAFEKPAAQQN